MFSRTVIRSTIRFKQFHTSSIRLTQKPWKTLSLPEQKEFITSFVALYKEKNSCSKNYYKQLAEGMDEYEDIPSIWGLIYNDMVEKKKNNETTADFDKDFHALVKKH